MLRYFQYVHIYKYTCYVRKIRNSSFSISLIWIWKGSFVHFSIVCNQNVQCRTFDYDSYSLVCRLFEGAVDTGNVMPSESLTSRVGSVCLQSHFFTTFGQECGQCANSRYLVCSPNSNNTSQCPRNTFWNGIECKNQGYEDANYSNNRWCREDAGLNCSNLHFCTGKTGCVLHHLNRTEISLSFWQSLWILIWISRLPSIIYHSISYTRYYYKINRNSKYIHIIKAEKNIG